MSELRMAAIFRKDLAIPTGKMAAQAGHAFLTAWISCADRAMADAYMQQSQPKLVLVAPDLTSLFKIQERAKDRGVSSALIMDAARTVFSEPTYTVLGLGPMSRTDYNNLTRGLDMAE